MTNTLVPTTDLTKNADSDFTTEGNLPVMESQLMSIDMANAAFIMESLTNLYSDPHFSVAREYIANAIDSHIESGNTAPVEVTSPSPWSPNLVIKDQGVGMSQDDVFRYGTYGSSDKRDNLDVVGNFGMGSKSALAITNSFTITAVKDGELTMASIGRNDDGHGQVDIILNEPTMEPNGVTITIPITAGSRYIMESKIPKVIQHLPGGVVELDGAVNTDYRDDLVKVSDDVHIGGFQWGGTHLKYNSVYIVSGGFGYAVPTTNLYDIIDSLSLRDVVGMPESIFIDVPTGSVDLTPSREQLRMTARTKTLIEETVKSVINTCDAKYKKQLEDITTFEQAYELVATTKSRGSVRRILKMCPNLEVPASDNLISDAYRDGDGAVYPRHVSNFNMTVAENLASATDHKAILIDMDKDYSVTSLTSRVKSFLTKVTDTYNPHTPVMELSTQFTDDTSNTKDNLYRYIERTAVRMKASEIYSAVNEYNKANRKPSANAGTVMGTGDDAKIDSVFISGSSPEQHWEREPRAGEMKKYYEDMTDNERPFIYILNNPRASGKDITVNTINTIHALQKTYDEDFEYPNVVLINGGVRKAKYFSQRGMDVSSVDEFMDSHKEAFQDQGTLEKIGEVYLYLRARRSNYRLDTAVSRAKYSLPSASSKINEILSYIFPELGEGAENILGLVSSPIQVSTLLRNVRDWRGGSDAVTKILENIENTDTDEKKIIPSITSLLETCAVLSSHGHADEGYAMLDQAVDLLTKEEG